MNFFSNNFFKKYLRVFNLEFSTQITYQAEVFLGMFLNICYLFITIFFWNTVFATNPSQTIYGFDKNSILVYTIVVQFLVSTLITDSLLWKMSDLIVKGDLVIYLTKPVNFYIYLFSTKLGESFYKIIFKGIPFLFIFFFFDLFKLPSLISLPFFLISLLLAFILQFSIIFVIASLSAWFENPFAANAFYYILSYTIGGRIIPIEFFTGFFGTVINLLPFKHTLYTPAVIYAKGLGLNSLGLIFGQVFWVVVLIFLVRFVFNRALKTCTVLGG